MKLLKILLIIGLTQIVCINLVAQETGSITGVVKDKVTGEELFATNVWIVGTSYGAATNMDGEFIINSVPQGEYVVSFKYIGYKEQTVVVDIGPSSLEVDLEVDLELDVIEGEEVVVTVQAQGQIAAINQQLTSEAIINVVSSDKLEELPDANAAESVGRLPGVSIKRNAGEGQKVVIRGLSPKYSAVSAGICLFNSDVNALNSTILKSVL